MSIDWDADLSQAVHAAFGIPVTYTPKNGTPFTLPDAIFEDAYDTVNLTPDGPQNGMTDPVLKVRLSEFPTGIRPAQNDRVTVGTTIYIVKQPRPDLIMGDAKLVLQKTPS